MYAKIRVETVDDIQNVLTGGDRVASVSKISCTERLPVFWGQPSESLCTWTT